MSVHSLEIERQHILDRMQARRETYRRALVNGEDIGHAVIETHVDGNPHPPRIERHYPTKAAASQTFPRSSVMRVISEHPLLCVLGVAAVIAIGPKRIARGVMTGGTTLTALTARNQSNIDMLGRLLTMAGAYVQGRTNQKPPR